VEDVALWPLVVPLEEKNDRNFENRERMLEELDSFFLPYSLSLDKCIYFSLGVQLSWVCLVKNFVVDFLFE
jgi:hypothetical protein